MMIWVPIGFAVWAALSYAAINAVLETMNQEHALARKTSLVPPRSSYAP